MNHSHRETDGVLSPTQRGPLSPDQHAGAVAAGHEQNFIKVKLGGNTYHVHISDQERQARKDAKQRAAALHKETVRRKRNMEQKKLSHEQKEEQHRQQVLSARRAQLMLQTQRYLRATSRRPIPPQYPRNKTIASPRPLTAVQYPSGSRSARDETGEVESVLRAIHETPNGSNHTIRASQRRNFQNPRRPTTSQNARNYKAPKLHDAHSAYTITQVNSHPEHQMPKKRQPRVQSARVYSAFDPASQDELRRDSSLKHQSMRSAIDKFNQELLNVIHQPAGSGDSNDEQEKTSKVTSNPATIQNQLPRQTPRKTWHQHASGDREDNDTFRMESAMFPEKLHRIEPNHEAQVVMRAEARNTALVREEQIEKVSRIKEINTSDRHIPSPVERVPTNPLYTPQPPSSAINSDPSPPKYESVFEIKKPAPAPRLQESVASVSSVSSIMSIEDDESSETSSTVINAKPQKPKGILRARSAGNLRTHGSGVADSLDITRNRAKSAAPLHKKSVRWKQIEYQDGTVRPFPQDIDELRQRTKTALYQPIPPKSAIATSAAQVPPRANSAPVTRTKRIIQDAQKTGYAQQHVARRQFQRLQNTKKQPKRMSRPTSAMSDHDRDRLEMTRNLDNRRTPTDQEITQLWRTVKHVISTEQEAPTPAMRYASNGLPQAPTRSSVRANHPQQMPQSYYLPRPPVSNAPSATFIQNNQGPFRNNHTQRLNRPKVHNLSALSMEEKRLVQSLDRLNSRLNEIEVSVKKD